MMLDVPNHANDTTIRFSVEATYLNMDCSRQFSTTSYPELVQDLGPLYVGFNSSKSWNNGTGTPLFYLGEGSYKSMGFNSFILDMPIRSPTPEKVPEQVVLKYAVKAYNLDPKNASVLTFFAYDCTMTMPRMEAEVSCNGLTPCYVNRMRKSQRFNVSTSMTPFNDQQALGYAVAGMALPTFLGHFLWASGAARIFQRTASE